jgi:hypothetical protein
VFGLKGVVYDIEKEGDFDRRSSDRPSSFGTLCRIVKE